jgi:molybdopterin/thiamine biosynthesis adenylyltransferase
MKPIVYIPESQLQALKREEVKLMQAVRAVGFEARGENVFQVYLSAPQSHPTGYPLPAFLLFVSDVFQLSKVDLKLTRDELKHWQIGSDGDGRCLLVFISQTGGSGGQRVFLWDKGEFEEAECTLIPAENALFERNRGLLELGTLAQKKVLIVGLGSFGGSVAVELAKAGVGGFSLWDPDRMELGNLARHVCGLNDLGRHKTRAVRDLILQKNPYARVETFELDVNSNRNLLWNAAASADLIFALTDENRSRFLLNELGLSLKKTVLFGRAITRAVGGDVFRLRPGAGPCLSCLFEQQVMNTPEEISGQRQAQRDAPAYMTRDQIAATIQPGLSIDIAPMIQLLVKLGILDLGGYSAPVSATLAEDLNAPFYIWANRRELIYENWPALKTFFNRNSILRWYGVRVEPKADCLNCGHQG